MSQISDNNIDDAVDDQLKVFLDLNSPKSFFLFAGAGSGKTRSLVDGLDFIRNSFRYEIKTRAQRVAVITYTNAATEEISRRVGFDPLFQISTIHSFIWTLIEGFDEDIRVWLRNQWEKDIKKLHADQAKGRPNTAIYKERPKEIAQKEKKIHRLNGIKKFTYNPNVDGSEKGGLGHSEVLAMGADFLRSSPLIQNILVGRHPFLFIDESQDTNKKLMDAFLEIQAKVEFKGRFAIGLFGDMMQRIYFDGKPDIETSIGDEWGKPAKVMNHRSQRRIVELINKIRFGIDKKAQMHRVENQAGCVRFFIANQPIESKTATEQRASERMAVVTGDVDWSNPKEVKYLVLEHRMAASRLGFLELFDSLSKVDSLKSNLAKDGGLPALKFFSEIIYPLILAHKKNDEFAIANLVKQHSPLFEKIRSKDSSRDPQTVLDQIRQGLEAVYSLWSDTSIPTLKRVLEVVATHELFLIPQALQPFCDPDEVPVEVVEEESEEDSQNEIKAWESALACSFDEVKGYSDYVNRKANFDTHQGVKGLEFPRVLVVIDEEESRGTNFSYDRLFGLKEPSNYEAKQKEGKEPGHYKTQRLFYVTCSRAEESLAVVAYTANPDLLRTKIIASGWFSEEEIEFL